MAVVKRGKLLRGDLANWDGRTATASRVDATGGTISGLPIGTAVDVLQVYGDGTSRTNGTIAVAIARVGAENATLAFSPGTWTIAASLTVPSNFSCFIPAGCVFDVDSGKTLTFSGPVTRESATFKSGSGSVVFLGDQQVTVGRTAGESSNIVFPIYYQYPPGDVRRYGADPSGVADSTAAITNALLVGGDILIPPGSYKTTFISVTLTAHVAVYAYGATLVNATQVADGASTALMKPVLRIIAGAAYSATGGTYDVRIYGLEIQGPRVSPAFGNVTAVSYTGCVYEENGYPDGIDLKVPRNAVVQDCRVTGVYRTGIEAHYAASFTARNNYVGNTGYAGIAASDTLQYIATDNDVYDIGTVIVIDGYGVMSETSYNTNAVGATQNGSVYFSGNRVRYCKRKPIDCHSGLDIRITGNFVSGFGYSGIYAVCEDNTKRVGRVLIADNDISGDTTFVASASAFAIDVGQFLASCDVDSSFGVKNNLIHDLSSESGIICTNGSGGANLVQSFDCQGNQAVSCTFTNYFIATGNNAKLIASAIIDGNTAVNTTAGLVGIYLRTTINSRVTNNAWNGTAPAAVYFADTSTNPPVLANNLVNGAPGFGMNGAFTLAAAATKVVANTYVTATSKIVLTPVGATAATLMGSTKSLYISARTAGASFTVATADGTAAAGNEQFEYEILY